MNTCEVLLSLEVKAAQERGGGGVTKAAAGWASRTESRQMVSENTQCDYSLRQKLSTSPPLHTLLGLVSLLGVLWSEVGPVT